MKKVYALIIGILILTLAACGSSRASYPKEASYMPEADFAAAEPEAAAGYAYDNAVGYPAFEESGYETAAAAEAPAPEALQDPNRKLIKNVYLTMETKNYTETASAVRSRITELGGYVESSSETTPSIDAEYSRNRYMSITARIPSNRLDEFIRGVEASGNVTNKDENVQDITLQYSDTEARRNSLRVEQERLNDFMKRAETVEELITIESRLSEVRYELESIESRLRTFDNQVDYATVSMQIREVATYTPVKEAGLWERISEGFRASASGMGRFFENLLVFVLANSPLLVFLALLVVAAIFIVKSIRKNGPARKEKRAQKEARRAAEKAEKAAAKAKKAAEKTVSLSAGPAQDAAGTDEKKE